MAHELNAIVQYFEPLLNFTYRVINSMKGKTESDPRILATEYLATKIFLHAATVNYLRRGTNVSLSAYPQGANIVDFPSAVVIARAILETYLNLFEIFFEPKDDDEFEYRRAVYEIKGSKALELAVKRNPNPHSATADDVLKTQMSIQSLQGIRQRIKRTKVYQALDPNQQKATLDGKLYPDRSFGARAAASGFGQTFIEHTYMYLSSFTHGDALSASQTNAARTDNEKDTYFQIYMSLIMMVLASVILNYASKFPEAKAVCDTSPKEMALVKLLADEIKKTR